MSDPILFALLFLIPSALGVRATWRLWRVYRFDEESRASPILLAFALVATLITAAAIWFGVINLRRLLGLEPIAWAPTISIVIAAVILLIPAGLERLVDYVGKRPPRPRRPGRDH